MVIRVVHDWRAAFFGMKPAPPRIIGRSFAMAEAINEERRRLEREERFHRDTQAHVRALTAADAEAKRAADERAVREDVAAFGARTVLHLRRRVDPNFALPADLAPATEEQEQ